MGASSTMKILFLTLCTFAVAVSALPEDVMIPEEPMVEDPMVEDPMAEALLLQQRKGSNACKSLANSLEKAVRSNVKALQSALDAMPDGSKCKDVGKSSIKAAKKLLSDAQKELKQKKKDVQKATDANVNFGKRRFGSLNPNSCATFFDSPSYKAAKKKHQNAVNARNKAQGKVSSAQKGLENAKKAEKEDIKKCKCDAFKAHEAALKESNSKAERSNRKGWSQAAHLKCVLAGKNSNCKVPTLPKVKAAKLAKGVDSSACAPKHDQCTALAMYWKNNKVKGPASCNVPNGAFHMDSCNSKKLDRMGKCDPNNGKYGYFQIRCAKKCAMGRFQMQCGSAPAMVIQYSDDGDSWTTVRSISASGGTINSGFWGNAGKHTYWRARFNGPRSGAPWYHNMNWYDLSNAKYVPK